MSICLGVCLFHRLYFKIYCKEMYHCLEQALGNVLVKTEMSMLFIVFEL